MPSTPPSHLPAATGGFPGGDSDPSPRLASREHPFPDRREGGTVPMRRKWLALAALVAAFALVAAACGGNNDTSGGGNGDAARAPDCLNFADLYALIGPESEGFDNWSDAEALAQQVDGLDSYPDAPLTITAPGEESGTYDSFIELALAGVAETRLESGDITEDQVETTRPDYQASPNDNVIIEGIAGSEASLGWVGFSFYEQNRDVVRAI